MTKNNNTNEKSINIQKMFDDNVDNLTEIKEIIEMHSLCIKELVKSQKLIEKKLTELYDMFNKIKVKK
jgi:hypothetical protein